MTLSAAHTKVLAERSRVFFSICFELPDHAMRFKADLAAGLKPRQSLVPCLRDMIEKWRES